MGAWEPWTKCSEQCDCGLKERTRETLDDAGDEKQCPHDAEASTCNCDPCDEVKKTNPSIKLPASSSHGFTPAEYKPAGGFPTDFGEQAACVLDKAEAIVDLTPALQNCAKWDGKLGDPCYPESISQLIKHTEMCCEGREHFVLWKSDTFCEKRIAKLTKHLKNWAEPLFKTCIKQNDATSCAKLKSEGTYNHFAMMLREGLMAAKDLYAKGKPGDKTPAAEAFLKICVPEAKSDSMWQSIVGSLTSAATQPSTDVCIATVQNYVSKFDKSLALHKEDTRRRLRGN
jgi:hypothetical protein